MVTPNMATITASLERSLQNCSLNDQQSRSRISSGSCTGTGGGDGGQTVHGSDLPSNLSATPTLELNSQASLPSHWEQCLDLKTGEIYYINWRTGMTAKEDPRTTAEFSGGDYYSDEDNTSYDSDGSCSESSPSSSTQQRTGNNNNQEIIYYQEKGEIGNNSSNYNNNNNNNNVLVVAGCKSCLMYYMVPKQLEICPKCCGQLLHFDRSENGSS